MLAPGGAGPNAPDICEPLHRGNIGSDARDFKSRQN